jgi:hypothetical protein
MNRKLILRAVAGAALLTAASALHAPRAEAATRKFCYELLFKDDRNDCPVAGDGGVRRACQQKNMNFIDAPDGTYTNPVGQVFEVWDKDAGGVDEYIGTWHIGNTGTRCVTFEWENAAYSKGEANPDPYIVWRPRVKKGGVSAYVQLENADGADSGGVSWRDFALTNCAAGAACSVPNYWLISTDSSTLRGGRPQILDSAEHMLSVFGSIMDAGEIRALWPASGSSTQSRTHFQIEGDAGAGGPGDENRAFMSQSCAHELGHVLQAQLFEQDDLVNNCGLNGGGHSITGQEYQSCATTEGFADYVAAASMWNPDVNTSSPARFGFNYETAAPQSNVCASNAGIEGQVARALWDLDDANNEAAAGAAVSPAGVGSADAYNATSVNVAARWDAVPDGTGDEQDRENDNHGVNMYDYADGPASDFANSATARQTIFAHNCLTSQDQN